MKLVLASQSPRRSEILERVGISFTVRASDADETIVESLTPTDFVQTLAYRKAAAVQLFEDEVILAADTVVSIDDQILGKPQNEEEAAQMLRALSGRSHGVYTGVCLRSDYECHCFSEVTYVNFYPLSELQIQNYIHTGEPMDKAGAYGIQQRGSLFVSGISGDYFNVMGLPVGRIAKALERITQKTL